MIGDYMALYIMDNHVLYYHVDVSSLTMLGHSYFTRPAYLIV